MCIKIREIDYTKGTFLQEEKSILIFARATTPSKYPIINIRYNQGTV